MKESLVVPKTNNYNFYDNFVKKLTLTNSGRQNLRLPEEVWLIVGSFLGSDLPSLALFSSCSVGMCVIIYSNEDLRNRLELPYFLDLIKAGFILEKNLRSCRLPIDWKDIGSSFGGSSTIESLIFVNSTIKPVHFLLKSDFKTETYVSYFNFTMFASNRGCLFHYFVDGDIWKIGYDYDLRLLATWELNDVISFKCGKILERELKNFSCLSYPDVGCYTSNSYYSLYHQTYHDERSETWGKNFASITSTSMQGIRNFPLVITEKDSEDGMLLYVVLFKNYQQVHQPIFFKGDGEYWIGAKFAELKDNIEIIHYHGKLNSPFLVEMESLNL